MHFPFKTADNRLQPLLNVTDTRCVGRFIISRSENSHCIENIGSYYFAFFWYYVCESIDYQDLSGLCWNCVIESITFKLFFPLKSIRPYLHRKVKELNLYFSGEIEKSTLFIFPPDETNVMFFGSSNPFFRSYQ